MTEDEAKTKWCPFARVVGGEGAAFNRSVGSMGTAAEKSIDPPMLCLASACMAWRWSEPMPPGGGPGSVDSAIAMLGTDEQRARLGVRLAATRNGHCGLAGPPAP